MLIQYHKSITRKALHEHFSPRALKVILIFGFMAMLVHQFEEYAWPGGFLFMERRC